MLKPLGVTVWNESIHEQMGGEAARIYPGGLHKPIVAYLEGLGHLVRVATIDQPEHGLTEQVLDETDVLLWWGHLAHEEVDDRVVDRVHRRVLEGMGFIPLHSAHFSKIFRKLMGTSCGLTWRSSGERECLWVIDPSHPIARGIGHGFQIPNVETYGEPFDIPEPHELVFISSFQGGEVFRSGCCFRRGLGRIFYFRPGDQDYPIFFQQEVLQVIGNAVLWAAPGDGLDVPRYRQTADGTERPEPLEGVDDSP